MDQKDALTVLLTGRGEANFASIIKRMTASQKLEFDLIGLKPEVGPNGQQFSSTMKFKQNFLEDLVYTYDQADEIRVYEDRVKQYVSLAWEGFGVPMLIPVCSVKGFRDFFHTLNRSLQAGHGPVPRKPLNAEVIQVTEGCTYLDPVIETAEVQRMINSHNLSRRNPSLAKVKSQYSRLRIKRAVFYTGYLISQQDSQRIIDDLLSPMLQGYAESNDMKYMANSILITPRPATQAILRKVGGIGKKVSWQVTGLGVYDNKVWAAQVVPIPSNEHVHTENPTPLIVLACRRGSRPVDAGKIQNWQPVPAGMALKIDTVVAEKAVLRVEEDHPHEGEWDNRLANRSNKRRHQQERDEDILYPHSGPGSGGYEPMNQGQSQGYHPYQRAGDDNSRRSSHRGRSRGNGRGRGAARAGRGRGRGVRDAGPNHYYKSLDDQGMSGYDGPSDKGDHGAGGFPMDY